MSGRLDIETEGLIVVTNDGEAAHRLVAPLVRGPQGVPRGCDRAGATRPRPQAESGRSSSRTVVAVDHFRVVDQVGQDAQIELTLHSGRNRVVRRMMAEVGLPVRRLVRLQFGPIRLGRLHPGGVRLLTRHEQGAVA